jgi:hypothetical protein
MTTKEYAFDNGFTNEECIAAWENAKTQNKIIKNLDEHGRTWPNLPIHLFRELMKRYAVYNGLESEEII